MYLACHWTWKISIHDVLGSLSLVTPKRDKQMKVRYKDYDISLWPTNHHYIQPIRLLAKTASLFQTQNQILSLIPPRFSGHISSDTTLIHHNHWWNCLKIRAAVTFTSLRLEHVHYSCSHFSSILKFIGNSEIHS